MNAEPQNQKIIIYTDGACSGNPGPGGWGAVLIYQGREKELSGGAADTTNNRMEMMAVIEGLKALTRDNCSVAIYTDSTYVMKGMTEWIAGWKRKGWKSASGKPVKNKDLWQALEAETLRHTIEWNWVKGHSGDKYNEIADQLAVAACKKIAA